ncbi:unnamed protein product [Arabidopsis halleri]
MRSSLSKTCSLTFLKFFLFHSSKRFYKGIWDFFGMREFLPLILILEYTQLILACIAPILPQEQLTLS